MSVITSQAPTNEEVESLVSAFDQNRDQFDYFRRQVTDFFLVTRQFNTGSVPLVHSVKSRLKDPDHLRQKIRRKWSDGPITVDNIFNRITDLAGVRVLHLYSRQFAEIHEAIKTHVESNYWCLFEPPVAYSWDPEATAYFQGLGLRASTRDSYYTSIHYVVKPQIAAPITCEIQIRTLFEEAWGEIDHALNYPAPTDSVACKEQIRVLAKLASTGTRLADSIFTVAKTESNRVNSPRDAES
ncbi:RelA/SpoT domain-containing protein [Burkholderia ubonensis]|uniref:RelA/SpoT domain-containing protein n=1 Tax=Burkholderia ubonensis TaxID=101571 RepID=UPI000B316A0D|nr:RelA/SpoT domain-containing protein [Burkholderia ubonensis]